MKNLSFFHRILIPTLAIMLVLGSVLGFLIIQTVNTAMEDNANDDVQQTANFAAEVSIPYILNYDLTALGNFVKGLTNDSSITYAEFLDVDGRSFTEDVLVPPENFDHLMIKEVAIKDASGAEIGKFRIGRSKESILALRQHIFVLIGAGTLVLLIALGLGIAWVVRKALHQLGGEPQLAIATAHAIAGGDLSSPVPVTAGDTHSLMAALAQMQKALADVVAQVHQGSEAVAQASAEIAQGNHDLSERTEQQASALQQTNATMAQLGATVEQNAHSAREANRLSQEAAQVAAKGGDVVGEVVSTMRGIHDASHKIGDIIGVIDGIAFQTNILALNAAVEAARAGEQGRGFAVVAGEVRNLAGRSAEAAKEIKQLIHASVNQVAQGSALVDRAGETMNEVVQSIGRVTHIMGEISSATLAQSDDVSQMGQSVQQMDQSTQQNAALVEEIAAAASGLNHQARELVQVVALFKVVPQNPSPRLGAPEQGHSARLASPAARAVRRPSTPLATRAATPAALGMNRQGAR